MRAESNRRKRDSMTKVATNMTLQERAALEKIAANSGVTVAELVRDALREFLKRLNQYDPQIPIVKEERKTSGEEARAPIKELFTRVEARGTGVD